MGRRPENRKVETKTAILNSIASIFELIVETRFYGPIIQGQNVILIHLENFEEEFSYSSNS